MRSNLRKELNNGYLDINYDQPLDEETLEQELIKQRVDALREISVTGAYGSEPPKIVQWCADAASPQTRLGFFVVSVLPVSFSRIPKHMDAG